MVSRALSTLPIRFSTKGVNRASPVHAPKSITPERFGERPDEYPQPAPYVEHPLARYRSDGIEARGVEQVVKLGEPTLLRGRDAVGVDT